METAFCIIGGCALIASSVGLAYFHAPDWTGGFAVESAEDAKLKRWVLFQRTIRQSINWLLAATGGLMLVSPLASGGLVWMLIWLAIIICMLAVLMLAAVDAFSSIAGYRRAIPEAARRSSISYQRDPQS